MFLMVFVHMFMICLHTGLHMSSYNGSLFIAIKPNFKYRFRAVATFFYSYALWKRLH